MNNAAKKHIMSWWILALMSLFLWYRNKSYDRMFSVFVFTVGLIQLIEYGVVSGANSSQAGDAIFMTLWLQCLVLAIGSYIYLHHNSEIDLSSSKIFSVVSGWNLFLYSIIFVIALLTILFNSESRYTVEVNKHSEISWYNWKKENILGSFWWLYLIGVLTPVCLVFAYYSCVDLGLATMIVYGIISAAIVLFSYPIDSMFSTWSYLAIGFAFLAWMINLV